MSEPTVFFSAYVHVTDADGANHVFSPGSPVPGWARPLVGDHVVSTQEPSSDTEPELIAHARGFDAFAPEPGAEPSPDDDIIEGEGLAPPMPPTSGPGSSADAWVRYAHQLGETEPNLKWSRQKVIDLLIRKGLIVE